jgi:hypothetical protein
MSVALDVQSVSIVTVTSMPCQSLFLKIPVPFKTGERENTTCFHV